MAGSSGVFIRCKRCDDRKCLNSLHRLMKPSQEYICLKVDDTYCGLKIFFKDSLTGWSILREQHLWITGKIFPISSLTTTLIVHTELSEFAQDFEEVLRNGMQHIGPTLKVSRQLLFDDIPNSYTGDWKIVLDVPEIEDLEVFRLLGSPNNMTLDLPGFVRGFRVSFCCSFCDTDGHTLSSCSLIGSIRNTPEKQAATQSSNIDSNEGVKEPTPIASSSQQDSEEETNEEKKPSMLPNHTKTLAGTFGEERVRQEFISHSSNTATVIVKESEQDPNGSPSIKHLTLGEECSDENEYKPSSKYAPKPGRTSVTTFDCRLDPCPTSHCGGQLVLESPRNASRKNASHNDSTDEPRSSNQEDTGEVPTSSRPDGITESVKSELPSTGDNESDASQNSPQAAATNHQTPRRRIRHRQPKLISQRASKS